jgi:hypothetical protein
MQHFGQSMLVILCLVLAALWWLVMLAAGCRN